MKPTVSFGYIPKLTKKQGRAVTKELLLPARNRRRMSNTDVDIDDVTISVNPPKILPRRSSSTAMDIYSEIRQSKEEELRKIIQEQESKIALLENEVTTLRNIIESSNNTEERENKN